MRAILLLLLSLLPLLSFDYSKCAKKLQNSFVYIDGVTTVALPDNKTLYISQKPTTFKSAKIIKHDPFIGLYLLEYPHSKKPLDFGDNGVKEMAAVYKEGFEVGEIQRAPLGFSWGRLTFEPDSSGVLGDICYRVYGVVNRGGFLDHKRIDRFLSSVPVVYSYLGFTPIKSGANLTVTLSDPFFEGNPFLEGDVILGIDGIRVHSVDEFYEATIYRPIGSTVNVKILRDGIESQKSVKSGLLTSGGLVGGSFLDRFGIVLSSDMRLLSITNPAFGFEQLRKGDKIITINRMDVHSISDIKRVLSKITTNDIKMLIERDNFMFFISLEGRRS